MWLLPSQSPAPSGLWPGLPWTPQVESMETETAKKLTDAHSSSEPLRSSCFTCVSSGYSALLLLRLLLIPETTFTSRRAKSFGSMAAVCRQNRSRAK